MVFLIPTGMASSTYLMEPLSSGFPSATTVSQSEMPKSCVISWVIIKSTFSTVATNGRKCFPVLLSASGHGLTRSSVMVRNHFYKWYEQ